MEITPKAAYPVDLHTHTNRSDGTDAPWEHIRHAAEAGLAIVAMTDHDIRPPKTIDVPGEESPVDPVEYAKSLGVTLIPGTEISCETDLEDVHLVCLGCDWEHPFFAQMEADVVRSKIDGYSELCERLTAVGMPVSLSELRFPDGSPVPEDRVQKKMIFELLAAKGFTKDWAEAKLMIKKDKRFAVNRRKPDPCEVIRKVHEAGGIVIEAHPYLVTLPYEERKAYIETLIEAGLDGIEARYTYDKTSYGGTKTPEEIEREVKEAYAGRLSIISGGSDYHNDGRKGVKNPRHLGEKGLTLDEFYAQPALVKLL